MAQIPTDAAGMVTVPLLGWTTAGLPALAEQNVEEEYLLPKSLIGDQPLFALRVKGDSMVNAGILDGDLALIRSQKRGLQRRNRGGHDRQRSDHQTVLKGCDGVRLEPENPEYAPIISRGVEVLGKVVWVFRKIS
jgi:repressor LexA